MHTFFTFVENFLSLLGEIIFVLSFMDFMPVLSEILFA